jgi:hypothetical protein
MPQAQISLCGTGHFGCLCAVHAAGVHKHVLVGDSPLDLAGLHESRLDLLPAHTPSVLAGHLCLHGGIATVARAGSWTAPPARAPRWLLQGWLVLALGQHYLHLFNMGCAHIRRA